MKQFNRFFKESLPFFPQFFMALTAAIAYVYTSLRIPILLGNAIDQISTTGSSLLFNKTIKLLIVLIFVSGICHYLFIFFSERFSISVSRNLRTICFNHLQRLPLSYIDTHSVGKTLDIIISDIDIISSGLQMTVSQLIIGLTTILGSALSIVLLNPTASIVIFVLTPFSIVLTRFLSKNTHKFFVQQSSTRSNESAFLEESLSLEKIIKGYQREKETIDTFNTLDDLYVSASEKATFYSSLTNPSTRLLNNVIYSATAFLGAYICVRNGGLFTIGQFSSLLSFSNQFGKPFNDVSNVITELQNTVNSLQNVYSFLDEDEESNEDPLVNNTLIAKGDVEISNLSFSYNSDTELIKDFNLSASRGQHIAIVGPTGCGKTTIINLLMRFYDTYSGDVCIDKINTKEITRYVLRSNIGMVLQDTWIKTASVKDNLAFANPSASLEEIKAIASKTHADDFIQRLPDGYNTIIGDEGVTLSDGQRQLLCITRLFLTMPPIIILDEATSSVDTKTERDIFQSLDELLNGKTSFIVAHRLSTIQSADLIVVMNEGKIIELGNHADLIRKRGFYYELYQSQYTIVPHTN